MAGTTPHTELEPGFSAPGAAAEPWTTALDQLRGAEIFWISTTRPDGRPHVTPLIAVWHDAALWFTTGAHERKARNLAHNPACTLTTGSNHMNDGLDIVLEGQAECIKDHALLRAVADTYLAKYGEDWRFTVRDGVFEHEGLHESIRSLVFRLRPHRGLGFRRGAVFGQTRWLFPAP